MIGVMVDRLDGDVQVGSECREFGTWMASEQRRIYLLCRRLLQDADEANTATQDVFLKAFKALKKGRDAELDNPERWITRIAINTCLDRLRSSAWKIWRKRPAPADEEIILQMTAGSDAGAEALLFAKQIQQRLDQALAKLSHRQRTVFALRHFEGMPLDEIAAVLQLDVGTVKAHLFRALEKMRIELRDLHTARERLTHIE